jgi:hypothetical protein
MEGDNPTRKYKWFRPRQAWYGRAQANGPTNYGTVSLFNDTLGSELIVLRHVAFLNMGNVRIAMFHQPGAQGTFASNGLPLVPGTAKRAGGIYTSDQATNQSTGLYFDCNTNQVEWRHDFPIAIVPPQYSVSFQCQTAATTTTVTFMWEAILEDELDYLF